jgi:acyl-CoA thioesterase I
MRTNWLIAAALLLCGCNREQAPPPARRTEAPRPVAPGADARPVIACFGDSLTAGFGLDPGQSYPDLLQQQLPNYHVVNFGVSGDTTQDGLARLPLVLAAKPKIVVLELGANDGLRGVPLSAVESNVAQMIEGLQAGGARVLLAGITLPPNYGPEYIHRFEAVYQGLAAKYKVTLIPFLLEGVGGHTELMQRDGLHPTQAGTKIVAATVLRALQPLL